MEQLEGRKPYSESECFLSYPCESQKIQNFLSADQTWMPGVNQVFLVLEWNFIFVLLSKILDRLKRLSVAQIPRVCLSRDAEHIRLTAFRWRCDDVAMKVTCSSLEAEKSMQSKVVINS